MSHTPGPWRIAPNFHADATPTEYGQLREEDTEAELILGGGDDERWICWTQTTETEDGGTDVTDEDRANAALIAAAPDLFVACQSLAHDLRLLQFSQAYVAQHGGSRTEGEVVLREADVAMMLRSLDAAIAKAERRTP